MTHKIHDTMTDALMLVGGSVVGAGMALLFAPHSGMKSRKELARFGKMVSRKSEKMYRNFTAGVSGITDMVGGKAGDIMHRW
jgi:gas vesicle protein